VLSRASIKAGNMLLLSFRAANRDPCGAYRLSAALARGGKDPFDLPFLSTHPGQACTHLAAPWPARSNLG
jgi:hypothetical protein